ncbi:MAG: branched-chain amino acid ABC transporter permease [Microbacteriaceae bacterium]|nr:branched-chain amino acid ABC transporter permease [Microbacteriaceae bacterium]
MDILGIFLSSASFILAPTTIAYALATLGLALHFGYGGLLNMGMAGFMALGAYGYAIGVLTFGLPWYFAAFVGIAASIVFALILGIPTLRLRGDYLAIVTIAAAEIVRLMLLSSAFGGVTGSADGLSGFNGPGGTVTNPTVGAGGFNEGNPIPEGVYGFVPFLDNERTWYLRIVGILILAIAIFVVWRLVNSPWGRVIKGIREDEDAVRSLGKNVFAYKLQVLIIGGVLGALGGLMLAFATNVNSSVYVTSLTFFLWTALLLGGAATVFGPLAGSIIFWVLQAFLGLLFPALASVGLMPFTTIQAAQIKFIIVGFALVLLVVFRPQGLFGNKKELTFVK